MASAEDLGKKLLAEVHEVGLDEIFRILRYQDDTSKQNIFGFRPLDRLLHDLQEASSSTPRMMSTSPIVELTSLHPGAGSTHVLCRLCAHAVLPTEYTGRQCCVIIIDADGTFSVEQLAIQIRSHLLLRCSSMTAVTIDDTVSAALNHIHIFRTQTLATTIATIDSLQKYLLDGDRHHSFDRQVGMIALESASAFYWQDKAEMEDAAFLASTQGSSMHVATPCSGYIDLTGALRSAAKIFDCPIIFTTQHIDAVSAQHQHRSYRSPFPSALATLPTLRVVLQRAPVRKFPANISLEAALREAADRQKAVDEGKFVCFLNEWGLEERVVQRLNATSGGATFSFRIDADGALIEEVQSSTAAVD